MTERATWSGVQIIMAMVTIAALAFGAGVTWGESRCMPAITQLRTQHDSDVRRLEQRIDDHAKLPIHPGAASSDIVRRLEERVQRLEDVLDERRARAR